MHIKQTVSLEQLLCILNAVWVDNVCEYCKYKINIRSVGVSKQNDDIDGAVVNSIKRD